MDQIDQEFEIKSIEMELFNDAACLKQSGRGQMLVVENDSNIKKNLYKPYLNLINY